MPTELPIPIEIPWQLAATTRFLSLTQPLPADTTSLSLFTFVPKLPSLEEDYPDIRLIYLKFTVSVSPVSMSSKGDPTLELLLGANFPIWGMLFDVQIKERSGAGTGDIIPYFLAASPTGRTMIESGAVGDQTFEGESNEVAIGKSGSQLHETFNSSTKTGSRSLALPKIPYLGSLGFNTSSTSISGSRDVMETVDMTNRQASEERRELFSHLTNVNNVLTLLTTSLVGSPYLRFQLRPLPLRQLSIDPADSNLWYSEFIKRRSSGIEGMQDFYAIAAVPRNSSGFCIQGELRRVFVIEPPIPPSFGIQFEKFDRLNLQHWAALLDYLNSLYPPGTPVEELDVDIFEGVRIPLLPATFLEMDELREWYDQVNDLLEPDALPFTPPPYDPSYWEGGKWLDTAANWVAPGQFTRLQDDPPSSNSVEVFQFLTWWVADLKQVLSRVQRIPKVQGIPKPVVSEWLLGGFDVPPMTVRVKVLTQPPSAESFVYKWVDEVWLEMKRAARDTALTSSPLLRGQPMLTPPTSLRQCFSVTAEGRLIQYLDLAPVTATTISRLMITSPFIVPTPMGRANFENRNVGREAVFAWNALDSQLAAGLSGFHEEKTEELRLDDDSILGLFLDGAQALSPDDPANQTLDEVLKWVDLSAARVSTLRKMNIVDLRSLAEAIKLAPTIERRKSELRRHRPTDTAQAPSSKDEYSGRIAPIPVAFPLSASEANAIRLALGRALQVRYEKSRQTKAHAASELRRKRPTRKRRPSRANRKPG
jgi:hypothetical protein